MRSAGGSAPRAFTLHGEARDERAAQARREINENRVVNVDTIVGRRPALCGSQRSESLQNAATNCATPLKTRENAGSAAFLREARMLQHSTLAHP